MKIYFLFPYPLQRAPSQRFRFEQYFGALEEQGIHYRVSPFLSEKAWDVLYKRGKLHRKTGSILRGYLRRVLDLARLLSSDFVFIHREASPLGPPVFEWIIARVLRKRIIYDFDDAIWLPNYSEHNSIIYYFKRYSNARAICRWAYKVSCGNDYLCDFARKYNSSVVYNPTTIDTEGHHNLIKHHSSDSTFVIGWTGSHSTLPYLDPVVPVLKELEDRNFRFVFLVISDKEPSFRLRSLVFRKWNVETEIEDLLEMDVGLMPLPDDIWARGKCGFKALQYNALGIPALVSPVGVNTEIIQDYVNGFVCHSLADWRNYLVLLMNNRRLAGELGKRARPLVQRNYSVASNTGNFLKLFS
jgi:glycosyltransferase involved in cell wall biosynthesis